MLTSYHVCSPFPPSVSRGRFASIIPGLVRRIGLRRHEQASEAGDLPRVIPRPNAPGELPPQVPARRRLRYPAMLVLNRPEVQHAAQLALPVKAQDLAAVRQPLGQLAPEDRLHSI